MKKIKIAYYHIAFVLSFATLPIHSAQAQEEFLVEVGKAAATFAVEKLVGAAYDAACVDGKAKEPGKDYSGDVICMAVGGAVGKDEEEFRRDMRQGLDRLNSSIKDVEKQLVALQEGQKELHKALDIVTLSIDLIPGKTEAHRDLVEIRGAWNDNFKPMINGERKFDQQRSLAYAEYLIFELGMERNLSRINETLVRPNSGNDPSLIEQHFNKIIAVLPESGPVDLEQPYLLLSSILESLLIEQARGEIMYAWAAAIIEAECATTGNCTAAKRLPHKTDEFRALTKRHRAEQLGLFNRLIDRMVLDRSDLHSIHANFLHHDAEIVMASADLFSAIHLREGFGIRGRVISAGKAFSGNIKVAGQPIKANLPPRPTKAPSEFDWWTKGPKTWAYETVHFTREWLTYEIVKHDVKPGSYPIETEFPWSNGPVRVKRIDLLTGRAATPESQDENVVEFGSFLAIARAGGAFAMMHDAWLVSGSGGGGTSTAPTLSQFIDGKVVYSRKSVVDFEPRVNDTDRSYVVDRRANVTFADGGKIQVHMKLSPAGHLYPGYDPEAISADVPADGALIYSTDYRKPPVTTVDAKIHLETGLSFDRKKGSESITWKVNKTPTRPTAGAVTHEPVMRKTFKFNNGEELVVRLTSQVDFSMPTSGFDATSYWFFTGIAPKEIYFTRE